MRISFKRDLKDNYDHNMSWTCPHQRKDNFCQLRAKECQPGSAGCTLSKKFKFIEDEVKTDNPSCALRQHPGQHPTP